MVPSFAVMLGGAVGALLRYGAAQLLPHGYLTTLGINGLGCLILGFFLIITTAESGEVRVPHAFRLGISTGVLGGFTTFSMFSVETWGLLENGDWAEALFYVGSSLLGGLLMAWLGTLLARKVRRAG